MTYNQLFIKEPNNQIIKKVISFFGIKDLNNEESFTYSDMEKLNTVMNLKNIKTELLEFYLTCKAKIYLNKWDNKSCVTICRQLLKSINYNLIRKEYCKNGKKYPVYTIYHKNNAKLIKSMEKNKKIVITFD